MKDEERQWSKRGNYVISPSGTPGIWEIQAGGYYVRTTVVDPVKKKLVELKKVFRDCPLSNVVIAAPHRRIWASHHPSRLATNPAAPSSSKGESCPP